MPRYFFDTHDGDAFIEDKEGIELGGMAPARRVALRVLAGMAHGMVLEGTEATTAVRVRDSTGSTVLTVGFGLLIKEGP
jgi:hypothetical protein